MNTLGFDVICSKKIDEPNVRYIRLHASDLSVSVREVFFSLLDTCWLKTFFHDDLIRQSIEHRCLGTIEVIRKEFNQGLDGKITTETGEYVVSESSRRVLVDQFNYLDIPLHEFFKQKVKGNPGFDYSVVSTSDILLFAEAKYNAKHTAVSTAITQIGNFVVDEKWKDDFVDINPFIVENEAVRDNYQKGRIGFVAAFSSRRTKDEDIIQTIKNANEYKDLSVYEELICIAVDLWEK